MLKITFTDYKLYFSKFEKAELMKMLARVHKCIARPRLLGGQKY